MSRKGCKSERKFSQRELERHISERLTREREKCKAFESVREILDELMRDGIINADSYAEAARELYERLLSVNVENTVEKSEEKLADLGEEDLGVEKTTETLKEPTYAEEELTADDGSAEDALVRNEVCSCENGEEECDDKFTELYALMDKYPSINPEELLADKGFLQYCKRYFGTLTELYEGYTRLTEALGGLGIGTENAGCGTRSIRGFMASTSLSSCSASPNADAGFELTPLQRDIAKRAGLSYREYSEMLRDIPKGDRIRK